MNHIFFTQLQKTGSKNNVFYILTFDRIKIRMRWAPQLCESYLLISIRLWHFKDGGS